MRLVEAVVLGLTQGLTEFLPISSSAHLRLVPDALGWGDPGASFTAVVQLGTIAAVLIVFRADLAAVIAAMWRGIRDPAARVDPAWQLGRLLVLGTVPILVLGVLLADAVSGPLRALGVIVMALLVGSGWLWVATRRDAGVREVEALTMRDAGLIGLAQAAALVPGISRSGATIGAGLLRDLEPAAAARFSFLLSVPAIVLAGGFGLRDLGSDVPLAATAIATAIAFVSGYASIRWLLWLVGRRQLAGFIAYRLALAVLVGTAALR